MNKHLPTALLTAAVSASTNTRIGVISDLHFNVLYNPASSSSYCSGTGSTSSDLFAPLGRYSCDPSEALFDHMITRFKEQFGTVDVIIIPGDTVAHRVSASSEGADPTGSAYEAVKLNLSATFTKLAQAFPNTVIVPTFGNNDARYHDEAIDETDKTDYYNFVYDLWFNKLPGNANLDKASIKQTLSAGGYFRADITPSLSILSMNSMYFAFDDNSLHGGEQTLIANWFEYELALAKTEGRKIIITDHVYAGSRHQAEELWHATYYHDYFNNLRNYHDQVVIEVVGHDHYADLRYHSSNNVVDLPDPTTKFDFHNMFVAAGMTPWDGSNPGISMFEVTQAGIPTALRMEFLNLQATIGKSSVSYSDLEFHSVNMAKDYNVTDLDATSLATFRQTLESDETYTLNYLISKLGFDPTDAAQFNQGVAVLTRIDLVTTSKHHVGEYLCQMHNSLSSAEYTTCSQAANPSLFLQ